jgi:hypothetical protein
MTLPLVSVQVGVPSMTFPFGGFLAVSVEGGLGLVGGLVFIMSRIHPPCLTREHRSGTFCSRLPACVPNNSCAIAAGENKALAKRVMLTNFLR